MLLNELQKQQRELQRALQGIERQEQELAELRALVGQARRARRDDALTRPSA
jgi:hypothetical protein